MYGLPISTGQLTGFLIMTVLSIVVYRLVKDAFDKKKKDKEDDQP